MTRVVLIEEKVIRLQAILCITHTTCSLTFGIVRVMIRSIVNEFVVFVHLYIVIGAARSFFEAIAVQVGFIMLVLWQQAAGGMICTTQLIGSVIGIIRYPI